MTSYTHPAGAEVEQAAKEWMEAAGRRDADALDRVLAAEFTMVTNRGSQIDKAQWLENMLHRVGPGFTPPAFLDVRVRVYGDAALMTSRNILRATFDGKDWSGELALTDVWVRRDGRWQLVRRHASNLVPGAS
jgi:ketosteroid isomerase-like protein